MKVLNTLLKTLLKIGVYILLLVYSYLLGVLIAGTILSLFNLIWNIFASLPNVFITKYTLIHLLLSIPFAIINFITMIKRSYNFRKQSVKKD